MRFSVKYMPTALFSLKDSNSTNSGAKALFLPSPYAIKMAILNQAITIGGDLVQLEGKKSLYFSYIRDAQISFFIEDNSYFSVSNSFVKILKPAREGGGFGQTVAFREYLYLSKPLEIIFETQKAEQKEYLQKYLHKINYFGKRGCFFQFLEYSATPNEANVKPFASEKNLFGILQEYDDFDEKALFENVSNFSSKTTKRKKEVLVLPLKNINSSKSFSLFKKD
ncbi:MAG: hypothetical protein LAT68_03665 [Cyclobacteriaceae bacterium]|nr:hypothetical protein [Cyclobacteriaceae bacterium]MCH8515407.1 hypothetical protein [Cyclobacteriaceae bacterium]